jgi:sentrin-specific protease 1
VSSILFDAEALAAYRARVEKSRRKDVTKNASVVSVGPSSDPSPSDVSSLQTSDQNPKSAKSALSPLQTRGVEVEAAASRAARDGDPAFKAREDEVSRLIEEMSVRAEALEKRRPSALTPAEEAEEDDVAALEADLTAPLTAEQEAAVDAALAPGPSHEVLASGTFAWQGDLSFTRKDVATMAPNQWLNDEMINFTVGAMAAREAKRQVDVGKDGSTQSQPKTHFMSTFFTKKLCGGEAYDYNAVRRWTTKKKLGYDALLCDTIIVPVHQGIHWVLATVELREKRVRLYDSLLGEDHFLLDCLKRWVRDEYENKKGEAVDTSGWAAEHPKEIPRQMNGCDCGVFMLKYADYIASGCPLTFTQADMAYFRRRIVADGLEAGRGGGE